MKTLPPTDIITYRITYQGYTNISYCLLVCGIEHLFHCLYSGLNYLTDDRVGPGRGIGMGNMYRTFPEQRV